MSFTDVTLPRPTEALDYDEWAKLLVTELERLFAAQSEHVLTQAIPKADLPSAVRPGILITIRDDSVLGVCQVYSTGTAWLRVWDNNAVDTALSRARTTAVNQVPNQAITNAVVAVAGFTGIAIDGAAGGGKKFDVSFGSHVVGSDAGALVYDWVEFQFFVNTAGTATGTPVKKYRKTVESASTNTAYMEFDLADFEIQTTDAADKLTVGVLRGALMGGAEVYTVSPAAQYYSHLRCVEVL